MTSDINNVGTKRPLESDDFSGKIACTTAPKSSVPSLFYLASRKISPIDPRLDKLDDDKKNLALYLRPFMNIHEALKSAFFLGPHERLSTLIDLGADIDHIFPNGEALIHEAARINSLEGVQVLTSHGADVNVRTKLYELALYYCKSLEMVQLLVEKGATVEPNYDLGLDTVLWYATTPAIAEFYLNRGVDPDVTDELTPLHNAPNVEMASFWVNRGCPINYPDDGRSPLHDAVIDNRILVAEFLILNGARLEALDNDNFSPLAYAVNLGHIALAKLLLKYGADIYNEAAEVIKRAFFAERPGAAHLLISKLSVAELNELCDSLKTPLMYAAIKDDPNVVGELLAKGVSVDVRGKHCHRDREDGYDGPQSSGYTALHFAGKHTIPLLLKAGASIHARSEVGMTPLHSLVQFEYYREKRGVEDVKVLLDEGASMYVSMPDNLGNTPLHYARDIKIYDLLLKYDPDLNRPNHIGETPIHFPGRKGTLELLIFLLNRGANVNVKDANGKTALHKWLGLYHGFPQQIDGVKALIRAGADIHAKDNDGKTPMNYWSRYYGHGNFPI